MKWLKKIFGWKHPQANHDFTDEDRRLSSELRAKKAEITKLKIEYDWEIQKLRMEREKLELEAAIEEFKAEFDDDDDSELDNMLYKILQPVLAKFVPDTTTPTDAKQGIGQAIITTKINIPDSELEAMYAQVPDAEKKLARQVPREQLRAEIVHRLPHADEDTIERALEIMQ